MNPIEAIRNIVTKEQALEALDRINRLSKPAPVFLDECTVRQYIEQSSQPVVPEVVAWQDVIAAIKAVDDEAARRGRMFPQTSDEQRDDRRATKRVVEMIEWYAKRGEAMSLADWPKYQPVLSAAPAPDHSEQHLEKVPVITDAEDLADGWYWVSEKGRGAPRLVKVAVTNYATGLYMFSGACLMRIDDFKDQFTGHYTAEPIQPPVHSSGVKS